MKQFCLFFFSLFCLYCDKIFGFAQVEDKRAEMERQLNSMKRQHESLQKQHVLTKQHMQRMKVNGGFWEMLYILFIVFLIIVFLVSAVLDADSYPYAAPGQQGRPSPAWTIAIHVIWQEQWDRRPDDEIKRTGEREGKLSILQPALKLNITDCGMFLATLSPTDNCKRPASTCPV